MSQSQPKTRATGNLSLTYRPVHESERTHGEYQYLSLLLNILRSGVKKEDRTGTGTKSLFGYQMRFPLSEGFPLLTTKKLHLKSIIHELLWFLRGETNISYLQANGIKIWDEWANEAGELGRGIYGEMWRSWPNPDGSTLDQISDVISEIKTNPNSRRMLVVAYNPSFAKSLRLPPCHSLFQFNVAEGKLSCHMYQRSADTFLGVPFNIASYALLTHMIAHITGLEAGTFIHSFGDVHLYLNHIAQAEQQLQRTPFPFPKLTLNPQVTDIDGFTYDDFKIDNYEYHPHIKAEVSV